ncbi:hypothetical protein OKW96_18585 [Sphingobacterium sp. KU25419]|nr:hypothetical protein OKW96_18585 [Sphingobacterium sp. KU25419]
MILLVHTKSNTDWFARLFDDNSVKQLFKGMQFQGCRPIFKLETLKTFKSSGSTPSEIVIACGLCSEDILEIEDFHSVKAIIAIPWLADELDKWLKTWNPTELRGNKQIVIVYPDPSDVVKKAMIDLSASINMSTGISHHSDNERAKTYILALYKYEPSLEVGIVGAYLRKELNWSNSDAKDIEQLINTLNVGKHFKGGVRTGLQNYYKKWK